MSEAQIGTLDWNGCDTCLFQDPETGKCTVDDQEISDNLRSDGDGVWCGCYAKEGEPTPALPAKTWSEDQLILIAWEAGELTEGQASKALGLDQVAARDRRLCAIEMGRTIGERRWKAARAKNPLIEQQAAGVPE